jgi:hypothetical protein
VLPEFTVWFETELPPLLLKVTVKLSVPATFHFAYKVMLEVTGVEKL